MTSLGDAVADMFDDLFLEAGVTVSVTRGIAAAVDVPGITGRMATERFGDDTLVATSTEGDFIFKLSDYITLVGSEPQERDNFQWTDDRGVTRRHQVGLEGTERHWDPVDQFGLLARVHTTEIGT